MNKDKKFDAVKIMREIREKLSQRYWQHPEILMEDMHSIHKKMNLDVKSNPQL